MSLIISAFYFLMVFVYALICLFIIFHLVKYSINAKLNVIMLPFFIIVSLGLLLSNVLLFLSIDWKMLVDNLTFY